jgi:hypothetical protein
MDDVRAACLRRLQEAVDAHEEPQDQEDVEALNAGLDICHPLSPENVAQRQTIPRSTQDVDAGDR